MSHFRPQASCPAGGRGASVISRDRWGLIPTAGTRPPTLRERFRNFRTGIRVAVTCLVTIDKARIEAVLDRVRPLLRADGGDIELVAVDGQSARVRLTGECAHCPAAHMTLHDGIEAAIRAEIPEFDTLREA